MLVVIAFKTEMRVVTVFVLVVNVAIGTSIKDSNPCEDLKNRQHHTELLEDPLDCTKYYECNWHNGDHSLRSCPSGTFFGTYQLVPKEAENLKQYCLKPIPTARFAYPFDCHKYVSCWGSQPAFLMDCNPAYLVFNPETGTCVGANEPAVSGLCCTGPDPRQIPDCFAKGISK